MPHPSHRLAVIIAGRLFRVAARIPKHPTMESLYLLIPMSLVLVAVIVAVLYWAVKSGQFDDLEGPAHSILMDDDGKPEPGERTEIDPHQ